MNFAPTAANCCHCQCVRFINNKYSINCQFRYRIFIDSSHLPCIDKKWVALTVARRCLQFFIDRLGERMHTIQSTRRILTVDREHSVKHDISPIFYLDTVMKMCHKRIIFRSYFTCTSCRTEWMKMYINFPFRFSPCPGCSQRTEARYIVSVYFDGWICNISNESNIRPFTIRVFVYLQESK